MNRVYKTKWSAAHQQYVVTDEHHATKGKASKSAVAAVVSALMLLGAGVASAAYLPGYMNQHASNYFDSQRGIWETAEYQKDWGLGAMHASSAYALGFTGKGVTVGVMDSGALIQKHPELAGTRFEGTSIKEEYGSTGNRYPQYVGKVDEDKKPIDSRPFKPGETGKVITGEWMEGVNDSHGTHVTGTVGANRDGSGFHGVAWESNIIVGNTGATDDNNYGPFQDYTYFKNAWGTLAEAVATANGERGGVINNSWGTNTRVVDQGDKGLDGYNTGVHLNVNTQAESDYEFMLFSKRYPTGDTTPAKEAGISDNTSFVYAAYEAVKDKNIVQIMTTGNRDMANPYYRALYPYYNPAAEKHWIAVAGLKQGATEGSYELIKNFNEAGIGKWWTVAAPGNGIYSSTTDDHGNPGYASWGGTSMAAPHVAGAMGVLMSRYDQMNALQVRDIMFTTANHYNADGSVMEGWTDRDGTERKDGEVSDRMGWGVPDLQKGMFGPGQFLGTFTYNMAKAGSLDVWSNDITNVALDQRLAEDEKWMADTKNGTDLPYDKIVDGSGFIVLDGDKNATEEEKKSHIVGKTEQDALIAAYKERADAITEKLKNDKAGYKGTLVKQGEGTLVMTGNNSYKGTTTVEGGTLLAFSESIGIDNKVTVKNGGTFGVLSAYDDNLTQKGILTSQAKAEDKIDIVLEEGGTLYVDAASKVEVKSVTGAKNVKFGLVGADRDVLIAAYNADETGAKATPIAGSFSSGNALDGVTLTKDTVNTESLFFAVDDASLSADKKTINVTMTRNDATFEDFAQGGNQASIAHAIASSNNAFMGNLLTATDKAQLEQAYATLDDDFYITARNALVTNAKQVTRAVIDQASGMGEGRRAEFDEGRAHVWATGMGRWGDADGNAQSLDVDFTVGMVGAEFNVCPATKLGAFFGYGDTDISGAQGKIDGEDKHFGIYGLTDIGSLSMTYGIAYTDEDRDTTRFLGGVPTSHSENASVLQGFVEGAYNFDLGVAKVSPYVGFTWARVETDDVVDAALGDNFKTEGVKDDIQIATIGARGTVPFTMGTMPVAVKADLGYSHFFGDTDGVARVQMGEGGQFATIEGSDLKGQVNFGLGIVGKVAKHATVGVSYTGAWGSDVDSHGIMGNLRINF